MSAEPLPPFEIAGESRVPALTSEACATYCSSTTRMTLPNLVALALALDLESRGVLMRALFGSLPDVEDDPESTVEPIL